MCLNLDYIFNTLVGYEENSLMKTNNLVKVTQDQFNYSKFENIDQHNATSLKVNVGSYEILTYMMKSLDPFITTEEESILRSVSPNFHKAWLYSSIIDAFLFKIVHNKGYILLAESHLPLLIWKHTSFSGKVCSKGLLNLASVQQMSHIWNTVYAKVTGIIKR